MIHLLSKVPGVVKHTPKVVNGVRRITPIAIAVATGGYIADAVRKSAENMETYGPGISITSSAPPVSSSIGRTTINMTGNLLRYAIDAPISAVLGASKGFVNGLFLRGEQINAADPSNHILLCVVKNVQTGSVNLQSSP